MQDKNDQERNNRPRRSYNFIFILLVTALIVGLIIFLVLRWKKKKSEDALLIKENNASNKIELVENFDN